MGGGSGQLKAHTSSSLTTFAPLLTRAKHQHGSGALWLQRTRMSKIRDALTDESKMSTERLDGSIESVQAAMQRRAIRGGWSSRGCVRCCSPFKERRELLIAQSVEHDGGEHCQGSRQGCRRRNAVCKERARPPCHEDSLQDDQGRDREKSNVTKAFLQHS